MTSDDSGAVLNRIALALLLCIAGAVVVSKTVFLWDRNATLRTRIAEFRVSDVPSIRNSLVLHPAQYRALVGGDVPELATGLTLLLFVSGSGCADCLPAAGLWRTFADSPSFLHAKRVRVWLTPPEGALKGLGFSDVAPTRPIEFRLRSGIDGVPLLVAFVDGTLAAAIGGVPTTETLQDVAAHLTSAQAGSSRAMVDLGMLTSMSLAERALPPPR